jgi:hypothetical protein
VKNALYEEFGRIFNKFHIKISLRDFNEEEGKEDILIGRLGTKVYMKLIIMMEIK